MNWRETHHRRVQQALGALNEGSGKEFLGLRGEGFTD